MVPICNFFIAESVSIPFVCSFDEYIDVSSNACGGFSYIGNNLATLTGLQLDMLPGTTKFITDFSSIGMAIWLKKIKIYNYDWIAGSTANNKTCNIPFTYNNVSQNFCVLKESQFQCQVDTLSNYDSCNLGIN